MWHDDEGDDAAGSGERPDPSTRHWRHPSELAQQGALPNPDPTPVVIARPANGHGWPLVAVGGCLAIVALGVIGFRTDLGQPDSLQAGTAATVVSTPTTSRTPAASASPESTISSTSASERSSQADPAGGLDGSAEATAWAAITGPDSSLLVPRHAPETSAPFLAEGHGTPPNDFLESSPLAAMAEAPVYGVYAAPGRDAGQLGSFIMIEDAPVTSSSSLAGRSTVWLRVETHWLEAAVVADDPITDVALLGILDDLEGVALPTLTLADQPPWIGAAAMVGYGDPETDPVDPDGRTGNTRVEPEVDTADLGGGGDDPSVDAKTALKQERLQPGTTIEGLGPNPDEATKAWLLSSDRRGVIYSLTKPLITVSGHLIHDAIRLTTAPGQADAGAPLRNRDGEIVGLVAHSDLPKVAAIPIDRVVEVVGWLQLSGVGDPAWLGLSVTPEANGLVVTAVDEASPASELAPGDLIVAIGRQPVAHPDSLEFAARLAGPGNVIDLTVDRGNRRRTVPVEVGTIPLP